MAAFSSSGTKAKDRGNSAFEAETNSQPELLNQDNDREDGREEGKTSQEVRKHEKGNIRDKDFNDLLLKGDSEELNEYVAIGARAQRRILVGEILTLLSRMTKTCGTLKMATNLQMLKRRLASAHEILGNTKSEANFLSIIVLVEFAIGNHDWRKITREQVRLLLLAIEVGKRDQVTFDDYNSAFRTFAAAGWQLGPTIDFGNINEDAE